MKTVVFALVALGMLGGSVGAAELSAEHQREVNAFLMKIASGQNKSVPMRVDKALVLKNVTVDGITLVYNYYLDMAALRKTSIELFGVVPTNEEIDSGLKASSLKDDCSDPNDPFFLVGAKIGRNYYDAEKNLLFSVINEKKDCKRLARQ